MLANDTSQLFPSNPYEAQPPPRKFAYKGEGRRGFCRGNHEKQNTYVETIDLFITVDKKFCKLRC